MPEISVRGLEMPESPIRKLAPLAADAKKRGVKVYHLNIGQPDLPTPQVGLDALKHIDRTVLEYSPSQGIQSYREKLTNYYKRFKIDVTADDIIITSGGSEAVLFAFMDSRYQRLRSLRSSSTSTHAPYSSATPTTLPATSTHAAR